MEKEDQAMGKEEAWRRRKEEESVEKAKQALEKDYSRHWVRK